MAMRGDWRHIWWKTYVWLLIWRSVIYPGQLNHEAEKKKKELTLYLDIRLPHAGRPGRDDDVRISWMAPSMGR